MIKEAIRRILVAIQHLHEHMVCHKDIKPENVMIDYRSESDFTLKLIDFNIS